MNLSSEHKFELTEIQEKLSNIFNELGKILVTEDDRDLDDIMQRVEQMKLEMDELIEDYKIGEKNENVIDIEWFKTEKERDENLK